MEVKRIWTEVYSEYLGRLQPDVAAKIGSTNSDLSLIGGVDRLCKRYKERRTVHNLRRLEPFLCSIRSFTQVISTFTQHDAQISVLVWGSISFVLELALQHAKSLDAIASAFEKLDSVLPRFEDYVTKLSSAKSRERFEKVLVKYYKELIGICHDSILFLRRSPWSNLFVGIFRQFQSKIDIRLRTLNDLGGEVDLEASLAIQDCQHQEVIELIKLINIQPMRYASSNSLESSIHQSEERFHNLPRTQNALFHGREDLLARLESLLKPSDKSTSPNNVVLYGLGGVGKTQIALQYAWSNITYYDTVLWVSAESSLKLAESYGALAHQLGVPEDLRSSDQLRERLKNWLFLTSKAEKPRKWLMIFDNVEDPKTLELYLPYGSIGSLIFTTRNLGIARLLTKLSHRIQVPLLTQFQAQNFLLNLVQNSISEPLPATDQAAAQQITEAVGCLPLAIEMIGRFVASTAMTLGSFVTSYRDFDYRFLFGDGIHDFGVQEYERSINTTWTVGLPHISDQSRMLMEMIAFLDPDGIPLSLFEAKDKADMLLDGPDEPSEGLETLLSSVFESKEMLQHSTGTLVNISMVTKHYSKDHLLCHRIVQRAVMNTMGQRRRVEVFNRLVFMLNASFPQQPDGDPLYALWTACEEFSQQVSSMLKAWQWVGDLGFPLLLGEVAVRCAWFLFEKGQLKAAGEILEDALKVATSALEANDHPGYSENYAQYLTSYLYSAQGSIDYESMSPQRGYDLFVKAKDIRVRHARPNDAEDQKWIAAASGNIAASLRANDRHQEALLIYQELLQRDDVNANRDIYLSNICICLFQLGRLEEALDYSIKALGIARELRGADCEQIAQTYFTRADIYQSLGDLDQAVKNISECHRIRQSVLPHHFYTGLTAHKLAELYLEQSDLALAIRFFREAFSILLGSEYHPGGFCRTAFALADVLARTGNASAAAAVTEEGIRKRADIPASEAEGLGTASKDYEKFVSSAHR